MRNLDVENNTIGYAGFDSLLGSDANRDARLKLLVGSNANTRTDSKQVVAGHAKAGKSRNTC